MKIALTGGIACGKSTLAKFLRELGIRLLDADDVVHELEASGGAAVPAIANRFGEGVLARDGSVDRRRLASIVFADPSARADLESILFPLVRARLDRSPKSEVQSPPHLPPVAIIPLLFESHWEGDYDTIVAITSPIEQQIDRMMRTRGYARAEAEARLAAQMPATEKAVRSDYVVVNDSTSDKLRQEAVKLVAWLEERAKHEH